MRTPVLLAAACLAACATGSGGKPWASIQRERLERLHAERRPDAALADVLRRAPRPQGQDPRHIDQREPPVAGTGPRPFRAPQWTVDAAVGVGNVAVRVDGTRLDDRADAHFLHLGIDTNAGVGMQVQATSSDAELFAGQRINDGVDPAAADASLVGVDAFPHLRLASGDGAWRMPVRVGLFTDWQHLEHEGAGVHRQWLGVGPRLVLEPTWRLLGDGGRTLDLVGHLGGDLGVTWFRESFHGGDDEDTTSRWSGEIGLGVRSLFGSMQAELGYRLQHTTFGPIDSELYGSHSRSELQRQQFFLGCGFTF